MGPLAIQVAPAEKNGESPHFRSYLAPKEPLKSPPGMENVTTVHELVLAGCKKFANKNLLGQREFIKIHSETREITKRIDGEDRKVKKEWQYFELGKYNWETFGGLLETIRKLGSALVKVGVTPGKRRFHLYAKTSREWMQTALSCASQNITLVTAYDTLGIEGLRESIKQTETHGILLDKENFGNLSKVLQDAPTIKVVVYRDSEGELSDDEKQLLEKFKQFNGGIEVYSYTEFLELGAQNPIDYTPPKPDDICCIMYTSGSTGPPKGVILQHRTVVAGVTGASSIVTRQTVNENDVFLSILPLAHIFEFTAELSVFVWGAALGYGTPKTISETNMRNCKGDMRELKPTILVAVPAVFELIKKGISGKVAKTSTVLQKVFWGSVKLKSALKSWKLPSSFLDRVVFKNIKEATGGNLRYVMNGGAPVSNDTRKFINTLIAPLIMGYGLTETNAMCAILNPLHMDMDSTGELVPSITVKLVDVPESGYLSKNNQGELWVRGPAVSPGYWKNDKETESSYTADGWFMTGDIGEITKEGKVRIVDRRKNLVKTLNGEYVAIERLEALYRSNKYVNNICVFADSEHARPVAVVVPMESAIKDLGEELGIEFNEAVVHNPKVIKTILQSLRETAKECQLRPIEWIAGLVIADEEWTPQNGFVTSAQKVQRKKIGAEYKDGLKEAFKDA